MLGPAEITVSVPIYNQVSSLLLTGDSTPVIFSVGGKYIRTFNSCNTGKSVLPHDPKGVQHLRANAEISGNAQVPLLQLLCGTSGIDAESIFLCIQFDYGLQCYIMFNCHCHCSSQSSYAKLN